MSASSDRDRKRHERAQAKKAAAALACAKALRNAERALSKFAGACWDAGDVPKGRDDTRFTLGESMGEFAGFLESVYDR